MNTALGGNAPERPICAAHDAMSQQGEKILHAHQLAERDQQVDNLTRQLAERDAQVANLTAKLEVEQFKRTQHQAETNARFYATFKQIKDIEAKQRAGEEKWRADMAELRERYDEIEIMRTQVFRAGVSEAMPKKTKEAKKVKKEKKTWGVRADFRRRDKKAWIKNYIKLRFYPLFGE